jgi:acyl-CoA synthetase (AMP-forming)/AMP-acid ligase II
MSAPAPSSKHRTLIHALDAAALTLTGLTFIDVHESETRVSWRQIRDGSRRIAGGLMKAGVRKGDRVALLFPTSAELVIAFFATQRLGAVPVPLYPPVRLGRLTEYHASTSRMLRSVGASLVLADARVQQLLGVAVAHARPPLGVKTLASLDLWNEEDFPAPSEDALALIQFSSGSTREPRPVALTHRQLLAQCAALETLMPDDDVEHPGCGVSWLPLYHDMGLIGCLLSAAYFPGPLVLLSPEHFLLRPAMWLRAISRHHATHSAAPSFAYAYCAQRIREEELEGVDLSSWRWALNGAEPVSVEAVRAFCERFERYGFDRRALTPVYGLSEAALAVTFPTRRMAPRFARVDARTLATTGRIEEGTRAIASVGGPIPGTELEVRDELGAVLPEGRQGRIFVRGPSVMSQYYAQPEASAAVLQDGWLDTGDLGFVEDGELYVSGRAKDVVIIRGANHAPQVFEAALENIEGVRPGCVVALGFTPDARGEEALLLLAETREPSHALVERIRGAVVEATGVRPHTVELLEPGTLPRTSSGKLRRAEARRRYLAKELTPPESTGPVQLVAEVVRSKWAMTRARFGERG